MLSTLIEEISNCSICEKHLPHQPRPVVSIHHKSKILIVGQAPGRKVHESGIPWNDQSGKRLREWLGVDEKIFYKNEIFGIVPMGFCYPGTGKTGDLPPRKECAEAWHQKIWEQFEKVELTLLIGQYAQAYYLKEKKLSTLTETVKNWKNYLPLFLPLPHPSPRNGIWLKKNPWFEKEVIPELQAIIKACL